MADSNVPLPAYGPRLQQLARRIGLTGFWPWWTRELNALVPSAPRAALARRRMRPVLVFDGDQATLWRPTLDHGDAVMSPVATIPLAGDADEVANAGRAALAAIAPGSRDHPIRVVLSLPPREVLRKRIALPAAVEENFRQALAYDLDRHTPFKADELYFDAAIVERDAARSTIIVDLAAVRRPVADRALKAAAAWGADVAALVPEPPASAATSRLNLLARSGASRWSAWTRWQFWLPVGVLAGLVLATVLIPVWQKREYAIQMITVANQARAQAAVSEALRQELDARVGDYNAALGRKYAFPSALQVVDTVSKLLPDDTWLTQFELKTLAKGKDTQRELLVRGESANAGRLVQLFEESQLFAQAAPRSPTTKIQPGPGEIFDLSAQLKPVAAPASTPLLASGADVPAPAASAPAALPPSASPMPTAAPISATVAPDTSPATPSAAAKETTPVASTAPGAAAPAPSRQSAAVPANPWANGAAPLSTPPRPASSPAVGAPGMTSVPQSGMPSTPPPPANPAATTQSGMAPPAAGTGSSHANSPEEQARVKAPANRP